MRSIVRFRYRRGGSSSRRGCAAEPAHERTIGPFGRLDSDGVQAGVEEEVQPGSVVGGEYHRAAGDKDAAQLPQRDLGHFQPRHHADRHDEIEAAVRKRKRLHVSKHHLDSIAQTLGDAERASAAEHPAGRIDATDLIPASRQLDGEQAGARPDLEHPRTDGGFEAVDLGEHSLMAKPVDRAVEPGIVVHRPPVLRLGVEPGARRLLSAAPFRLAGLRRRQPRTPDPGECHTQCECRDRIARREPGGLVHAAQRSPAMFAPPTDPSRAEPSGPKRRDAPPSTGAPPPPGAAGEEAVL